MSVNPIKAWLERLMYNPLQDRVKEVAELKERYEAIKEKINNSDMITISELIGFPVSKEHGEELMNRLSIYNKMTKKELMVLLLQYDWELLQMQTQTQEKITLEVFRTKPSAEEMKVATQKFHDAVVKMNETFKEKVSCRFCKFYENNCPLSVGYEERNNGLLFCYPNRICDDFEFREEL